MTIPQGIKRVICLLLAACFLFQNTFTCYGQAFVPVLTPPAQNFFNPPTLKYLSVNSANPNNYFNFLLDKGSKPALANSGAGLEQEAKKLIYYFFIGLTLPESSLWVNLRPDEPGRITSLELAQTDMGKLLLEQDLRLKKDVAQCLNPSQPIGKRFWEELYTQAELLLGKGKLKKTAITTSNRVWIVPDEAVVMETEDGALVTQAKLKVLLESEYLSLKAKSWNKEVEVQSQNKDQLKNLTEALMKSIVIPEITKEVNSGKNYAPLRQIYHSLILAQWFKRKNSQTREPKNPYAQAIGQSWLKGLESEFPWSKDAIWKEYLASFQKGEYQLKEKLAGLNRMYTSGGIEFFNGQGSSPLQIIAYNGNGASSPLAQSGYGSGDKFSVVLTQGGPAGGGSLPETVIRTISASSPLEQGRQAIESSLNLAKQGDSHAIRELLERVNAMANSQDKREMEIARQFIREIGKEIGEGLKVFIDEYRAHQFVNKIVLGGGVGENLGKGIIGEAGVNILIEAIQGALGRDGIEIVRSSMSDETRAFLAFLPAIEGEFAIALDIGGTNVRTALLNKNGVLGDVKRETWEFKDNPDVNREYVLDTLTEHIKNAIEEGNLGEADEAIEIGISWAGPGDYDRGIVTGPNIPGFVDFGLKGDLEERLGNIYKKPVRVRIVHDGAAGAIGEYKKGALGEQAGIYLILGTGIGAGIVDGRGNPIYAVAGEIERNLGEIGHHLVYNNESGEYLYRPGKDGSFPQLTQWQKSFEMRLQGRALAVRFGERLLETFFQESDASNNEVPPNYNPVVNDAKGSAASPVGEEKRLSSLEENKRSLNELETFEELYALLRLRRTINGSEDIFATEGLIQLIEKVRKGSSTLSMITRANGTRLEGLRNKVAELLFMENIQKKIEGSIGRYSEDREQESLQHMKQMLVALFKELSNTLVKNGDVKKLQELYNFLDFIAQRLISQDEDDLKLPFTPHGIKHSLKVVEYMLKAVSGIPMLQNKLIDYYGAHYIEVITLLGLLHDIGYAELERAGNELGKVNIKKGYHADLGAEIVEERLKEFLINWFGMNNVGSREGKSAIEDFIDAILLHGADNQNVKEEGRKGSGKHVYTPASDINNPLLMLLRLGDNLDITRDRLNTLQQNPWFMRILHRMFRDIGDTRMLTEEEFAYKIERLKKEQKEKLSLRLSLARRFLRGEISRDGFYRELKNSLNGDDAQIATLANQLLDLSKNKSLVDKVMAAIDSMNHESFPHFIGALAIREVDFSLKGGRLIIKAILTPIANNENWIPVAEFQINGAGRTNKALESLQVNGETLQVVIEYGDWANNSIAGPGVFGNLGVDTIHDLVNFNLKGSPQVDGVKSKGSAASPLQSKEQAIPQLNKFIQAIKNGKYRQKAIVDLRGLPSDKKVILVGDLHARLDNLKRIIDTDSNLEKIQRGEAVLVILGDAVHSETDLAEMDSSVEIMQFIMDLKIQNPDNVYYVLGNHDYLSNLFSKNGVAQGKLFRDRLKEQYGYAYINAYEDFIKESPLVVVGSGFVAVHGGPIKDAGIEEIQNVNVADESNSIVQRAQWGRYHQGYDDEDVKSFLKNMGQADGQLIVGHSPRRDGNWHWQLLDNHHIVFAGHDRVGYALVQNKKVNFVEATAAPVRLELIKDQEIKGQAEQGDGQALSRKNIGGRFIKGTKVTLNKVRLLEGKISKIVAGYAMEGILVNDIEVGKSIILERGNTSGVENIETIDDNTIRVRTKTSVYEVKIAEKLKHQNKNNEEINIVKNDGADGGEQQGAADARGKVNSEENANYGDWAPQHKGFPKESVMVLPLDDWDKISRVDLRRLPKGTLIYLGDTGTWVNYLIRIEDNGMINLWLNESDGSFYGPAELLGSYDAKTKSAEPGVIISDSAIGFPYFRREEGNLIDYKLTAESGWVQTFPFFRILYPEGSSRSSKKRIDESSSRQDESNIKLLGGQRSGGTLETEFIGDVWITAGSFVYKVSVSGDDVYFQRYEKDKLTPIGRVHSMSLNQQIQIGREDGGYRLSSDRRLSGRHFVMKISKKGDDRFSIFVEDLNSLNGTIVEWDTHSFSAGSKNSAASPLEQEGKAHSLKAKEKSRMALEKLLGLLQREDNADIDGIDQMLSDESILLAISELRKLYKVLTEGDKAAGHVLYRLEHSAFTQKVIMGFPGNILNAGVGEEIKTLVGEIKKELSPRELYILRLAALLHDIGKRPVKNTNDISHEEHGAAEVLPRVLEDIGFIDKELTDQEKETISYLVAHHSFLDFFTKKWNINSFEFVVASADVLGRDLKRIKMLYLLSIADFVAMDFQKNKDNSTRLLALKNAFKAIEEWSNSELLQRAEKAVKDRYLTEEPLKGEKEIKELYLKLMGLPFIAGEAADKDSSRLANHLSLLKAVWQGEVRVALTDFTHYDWTEYKELIVGVPQNNPDLPRLITGILAKGGYDIHLAQINTAEGGIFFGRFLIKKNPGQNDDGLEQEMVNEINSFIKSGKISMNKDAVKQKLPELTSSDVKINFEKNGDGKVTQMTIETKDVRGLLFRITDVLSELKINLRKAIIKTWGSDVGNIFFIEDKNGNLVNEESANELRVKLERELTAPEHSSSSPLRDDIWDIGSVKTLDDLARFIVLREKTQSLTPYMMQRAYVKYNELAERGAQRLGQEGKVEIFKRFLKIIKQIENKEMIDVSAKDRPSRWLRVESQLLGIDDIPNLDSEKLQRDPAVNAKMLKSERLNSERERTMLTVLQHKLRESVSQFVSGKVKPQEIIKTVGEMREIKLGTYNVPPKVITFTAEEMRYLKEHIENGNELVLRYIEYFVHRRDNLINEMGSEVTDGNREIFIIDLKEIMKWKNTGLTQVEVYSHSDLVGVHVDDLIEFLGKDKDYVDRIDILRPPLSDTIRIEYLRREGKATSLQEKVSSSPMENDASLEDYRVAEYGGIDLSQIEVTLKDEKFVSQLNPADLKVLRAAKYLKEGWGSLALLYVHEIMLLLKDNLANDIKQKGLLQEVLMQLQAKGLAVPEIKLALAG